MSDTNNTLPDQVESHDVPKKHSNIWITLFISLLIIAIGVFFGYQKGLGDRRGAASIVLQQQLQEQFQMGVKAMDSGLYQVALKNFQFILQNDPNYPGAQDKLVEVLLKLSLTPTVAATITPMASPTPDTRAVETIFSEAQSAIANKDWDGALGSLDSLRKADPNYKTVQVDGMYYISLIQRGEGKIANADCKSINLEGGIYDLSLAERFGPLDNYSQSLREWARTYITGASFWDIDWKQALYYFDQLYVNTPYLSDSSCQTAVQRYRFAAIKYADALVAGGDVCGAKQYYYAALQIANQDNPLVIPTATYTWEQCEKGNIPTPAPNIDTPTPTITPTPDPNITPTSTP
jgi:tetratricopeptide (TPR) repeat protein